MMAVTTPLCGCGQPAPDAVICHDCTATLAQALRDAITLAGELNTAIARQARFTAYTPARGSTHPLPYDPRAAEAAAELRAALAAALAPLATVTCPAGSIAAMAHWLLASLGRLRQHPDAPQWLHGITQAVRHAARVIDRPPARVYAGPCDCGTDLTAPPGTTQVVCPTCGATHPIAERQERMRTQLDDYLGTATYAAAILPGIGIHVTAGTIRVWASRHRLEARHVVPARGLSGVEQPLYRLGDIITLALARDAASAGLGRV